MSFEETLRGIELHSENGTVLRCFTGKDSETLTFQILFGVKGIEAQFEPTEKKEIAKLFAHLAVWIGVDEAKKIIQSIEKKTKK